MTSSPLCQEDGTRVAHPATRPRTRSADVQLPVLSDAQVQANGRSYRSYGQNQTAASELVKSRARSRRIPGKPAIKTLAGVRRDGVGGWR